MIANPRVAKSWTSADRFIATHGDAIWELICDEFPINKPFRTAEAAEVVRKRFSWSAFMATRYTNAVLANVAEQATPAIRRQGYFWIL
jgi:hypothetical protein